MHLPGVVSLAAENALFHTIGQIFHPIFVAFATLLAYIYAVIPNYAISIIVLTLIVMALLTPLTVKSTKSMLAMQELQPEIKKLQQKSKGRENREELNREMMRLYKEKGINPAGGCLPFVIQFPFLIVLYDMIRGLTNTVTVHGHTVPRPEYIPHNSSLYRNLVHSGGHMYSFGMDLAAKPFSHHSSPAAYIPYFVLILIAIGLQYFQMAQMTKRNPQAAQANKQMQTMQKFMPILFAYIYLIVPAAVTLYMIVSTLIRIATQDVIFRTGIVRRPAGAKERELPSGEPASAEAGSASLLSGPLGRLRDIFGVSGSGNGAASAAIPAKSSRIDEGTNGAKGRPRGAPVPSTAKQAAGKDAAAPAATSGPAASAKPPARKSAPGGATAGRRTPAGNGNSPVQPKPHPRSKAKRSRKAR
jgi:YidC/Oxa1 family membrane protein insertase